MSIQDSFFTHADKYAEGQLVDNGMNDVISRIAEEDIKFGQPVVLGSTDQKCKTATDANDKFLGVAIRSGVRNLDDGTPGYKKGTTVSIVRVGRVAVKVAKAAVAYSMASYKVTPSSVGVSKKVEFQGTYSVGDIILPGSYYAEFGDAGDIVSLQVNSNMSLTTGADKYYGTDSSGIVGFYDLPSGGGGSGVKVDPNVLSNEVVAYDRATNTLIPSEIYIDDIGDVNFLDGNIQLGNVKVTGEADKLVFQNGTSKKFSIPIYQEIEPSIGNLSPPQIRVIRSTKSVNAPQGSDHISNPSFIYRESFDGIYVRLTIDAVNAVSNAIIRVSYSGSSYRVNLGDIAVGRNVISLNTPLDLPKNTDVTFDFSSKDGTPVVLTGNGTVPYHSLFGCEFEWVDIAVEPELIIANNRITALENKTYGDMTKAVYDTNNDGVVDAADESVKITGIDTAGNSKYYGTNSSGDVGFYAMPSGGGIGDMTKAVYDPQGINGDAFDRSKHTGSQAISTITGLQSDLDSLSNDKVDKVSGKNLSDENYTLAEKTKLANVDDTTYWKGDFLTLDALKAAYPTSNAGSYAFVDAGSGSNSVKYIWDSSDNKWVSTGGNGGVETPATIKTKYESNADTNAYDDSAVTEVAKIANKVDKVAGKELSTNDYSDADKSSVSNLGTLSTLDLPSSDGKTYGVKDGAMVEVTSSGDMTKAVYDTNNDGVVDAADEAGKITGIDAAGNSKYYGTNASGDAGFYDMPTGADMVSAINSVADTNFVTDAQLAALVKLVAGNTVIDAGEY